MAMTPRERFLATLQFAPVDRYFRWEGMGLWDETFARWHQEGLPAEINDDGYAYFHHGYDPQSHIVLGAYLHPGFEPVFEEKVLEQKGDHLVKQDVSGAIIEVPADGSSTIPLYLDFPVKNRHTWEALKFRLDPDTPGRLTEADPFIQLAIDQPWPLFTRICGLFAMHRFLFGFENLMYAYYDQPDLLHDMSRHWVDMWKSVLSQLNRIRPPDIVDLHEDMCGKNGPVISPAMFDEFMMPYYKELVGFLKYDLKIPAVGVDTDGQMNPLIPKFHEAGINFLWPFEVQAGMDVVKVRDAWPEMVIMGGIDKRALARDRKSIEEEVLRVVPGMLEKGGYIPCTDHNVPPDVPYDNFLYYLDFIRSLA
jgi:uroporphyrinogen decarboxylase